jgi:HAD superfamily hydrolase (TIGR01509 family)
MEREMQRIAVIFDVDGTLVDSNDAHARAWVEVFREAGYEVAFDRVRGLIGMGGDKLIEAAVGLARDDARAKRLGDRRAEVFVGTWLPRVRPLPGARALIERLRSAGTPIALATSARREELDALLGVLGMPELAEVATSSDDAERSKPDPDIVCAALDRLERRGAARDRVVMVGDTPYDLEAATRAGIPLIAVRSGGFSDARLAGAAAIFDGPADLLARIAESPIAAGV